jgi:hypothetical protein
MGRVRFPTKEEVARPLAAFPAVAAMSCFTGGWFQRTAAFESFIRKGGMAAMGRLGPITRSRRMALPDPAEAVATDG